MNFLFPFLAVILQASSLTLDKTILLFRRIGYKTYIGVSFPLIFVVDLVAFLIFRPPLSLELFYGSIGWFVLFSIIITIIHNIFFYRALKNDTLGEIQTLDLLKVIPTIFLISFIFSDERNLFIIIPALTASLATIWSHWEHHHFKIAKKTWPFLIWVLLAAPVDAALSKVILTTWNPISLELISSGVVALILGIVFYRQIQKVTLKVFYYLVATNILTSIAWIMFYFSYRRLGIIYTVLIISLQPLLVYFASIFILKERIQSKKVIAFAVVLISIVVARVIG